MCHHGFLYHTLQNKSEWQTACKHLSLSLSVSGRAERVTCVTPCPGQMAEWARSDLPEQSAESRCELIVSCTGRNELMPTLPGWKQISSFSSDTHTQPAQWRAEIQPTLSIPLELRSKTQWGVMLSTVYIDSCLLRAHANWNQSCKRQRFHQPHEDSLTTDSNRVCH